MACFSNVRYLLKFRAEFMIPNLTFSLRITEVLIMYDMKIYLSVEVAVIPMVGPSQSALEWE